MNWCHDSRKKVNIFSRQGLTEDFKDEHDENPSQDDMKNAYIAKFGEPKQVGVEPLIGKEHYFWRPDNKHWRERGEEPDFRKYKGWQWQFDPFSLDEEWVDQNEFNKEPIFKHSDYI